MEKEEEEKDSFENLIKWGGKLGITDSKATNSSSSSSSFCLGHSLSVNYYPLAGGRGLGAVRDLRKGELVLRVPKSVLLTVESISQDNQFRSALRNHRNLSSLQVEDAIWTVETATSKAGLDWKEAKALMAELKFKPHLLSFKAWLWAFGTISTRALHIPWDSSGCLCPVGDLFNYAAPGCEQYNVEDTGNKPDHSPSHANLCLEAIEESLDEQSNDLQRLTDGGFEKDLNAYCFYARENYKKGEQVNLSYGTYTNLELLEHYVFLLNENPNDKVFVPLQSNIYAITSWPVDTMFIHQGGKPSFSLLSALRLWAVPPAQRKSVGHLVYSGVQLSLGNETTVMDIIVKKCYDLLRKLPTSMEDDILLLSAIEKMQDSSCPLDLRVLSAAVRDEVQAFIQANSLENALSSLESSVPIQIKRSMQRWKLAVMWRLSYKGILNDCISYCTRVKGSLSCQNNTYT